MKFLPALIVISLLSIKSNGQNATVKKLNAPDTVGENSFLEVFQNRSSAHEFSSEPLSDEILSEILWAANGVNRPESGKRTAASALNAQDVDIYVFEAEGTYLYDYKEHALKMISDTDGRTFFLGSQYEELPPLVFLLVSDVSRFSFGTEEMRLEWAAIDVGLVAQNIMLYCAWRDLAARPRSLMEHEKVIELLQLTESKHALLNIPVSKKK
ncbi:MAG: SagB/ThcOx family dehydrogenase [Bacteroidales bacterium]|nr:SagB/ThcOx family dehydrogenase [Bacteroidales bacterium]